MDPSIARRARLEALFRATLARLGPGRLVESALVDLAWAPSAALVVGAGKAAHAMATGALAYLDARRIAVRGGVVVVPGAPAAPATPQAMGALTLFTSSHPVPDERSMQAALAMQGVVASAQPGQGVEVLALISGGASALVALPAPGLSLTDKIATIQAVARCGVDIHGLNTVRKQLSAIKGGKLAAMCAVPMTTLVVSDVMGDDLATVGSGPTLPDATTFGQARDIVASATAWRRIPAAVRRHLEAGAMAEAARAAPALQRPGDRARLVAGTDMLVDMAEAAAIQAGLTAQVMARRITGDVADVACRVAAEVKRMEAARPRAAHVLVAGGEPTITLPDTPGTGGRAGQLALHVARHMAGVRGISVLVAGSDGVDGNSPAAGAIVDGDTWAALARCGVDGERALERRDTYPALARVGAALETGPTGINHADLILVLSDPDRARPGQ